MAMTGTATGSEASEQAVHVHDKEWVKLFPEQVTENFTSSVTFIKQMTAVAVSTITYLKNAFPEESFSTQVLAGLRLKMLKSRCEDELAHFVSMAVQQAFDAFDKKYVEKLALCFYDGECSPESLIEYHVFEYTYSADGGALSVNCGNRGSARQSFKCSMQSVKTRANILLRALSLFVFQNCQQQLPANYDVSLRLYYSQDTPEDYQAPGFQSCTDAVDHLESTAPEVYCLGWVETPYHKLVARCFVRDLGNSDAAEASDNKPEMTQAANEESESSLVPPPRCPCGNQDSDQPLLTCQFCHKQQHQACFGFLAPVQDHCCESCADEDSSRKPSDQLLVGLEPKKRECVCIFRRVLQLCTAVRALAGGELQRRFRLSDASAAKMLRLLQSHAVLAAAPAAHDLAAPRKINHLRLKLAIKRFFNVEEQDGPAKRLAAETQRVSLEPAESPGHKATLQQYRAALHASDDRAALPAGARDDATLQQYRAALHASDDRAALPAGARDDATLQQYRAALHASDDRAALADHNPVRHVPTAGRKPLRRRKDDDDEDWLPAPKLARTRAAARTKRS